VVVDDTSFTPEEIVIEVGDSVTWENQGEKSHTVTSWYKQEDEDFTVHVFIGETWDSGDIQPGASYSRVFKQPGSFDYFSFPLLESPRSGMNPYVEPAITGGRINVIYGDNSQPVIETTEITDTITNTPEEPNGPDKLVVMDEKSLNPEQIVVGIGDTVTWVNQGRDLRTVTSWYSWTDENKVRWSIVGEIWDSGDIRPGESFSRVFDDLGSFYYISLPLFHYEYWDIGLMGVVIVE
jgi:plastocyanin